MVPREASEQRYPIDIVYLWVDGNDPEWKAIKDYYLSLFSTRAIERLPVTDIEWLREIFILLDSASNNRFNDNEELRYSLRSIYKFAPFVNHIYIVTMNQRPQWLLNHPKVTVVDHAEIFKDVKNLPTFNSHAIESNLHRIPGLSEHFIYFNDDVFLGRSVKPADFFVQDKVNVLFEKSLSPSGPPIENETAYRKAWRNTNAFLDTHFKVEPRYRLCHAAFALRKSYIEQFDNEFPEIFATNSEHKFRSDKDYNVTNGLLQYYWSYHDKVVTHPLSNVMVTLRVDSFYDRTRKKLLEIQKKRPTFFCLQDNMDGASDRTRILLKNFLEEYYPQAAPWEKTA